MSSPAVGDLLVIHDYGDYSGATIEARIYRGGQVLATVRLDGKAALAKAIELAQAAQIHVQRAAAPRGASGL